MRFAPLLLSLMASSILAVCALLMNELTHSGRIVRREKVRRARMTFINGKTGEPLKTEPTKTKDLRRSVKEALQTALDDYDRFEVLFLNSYDESEEMAFFTMGGTLLKECTDADPGFGWIVPSLAEPPLGRTAYMGLSKGPVGRETFRLGWGKPKKDEVRAERMQKWEKHQAHFDSYFMVPADESAADQHRSPSADGRPPSAGGHKLPADGQRPPSAGRHSPPSAGRQSPPADGHKSPSPDGHGPA